MCLSIGERKRSTPGSAEDCPGGQAEMGAQALEISNKIPGCIMGEGGGQIGLDIRRRPAAATLVVKNYIPALEVEQLQCRPHETAAGSAMEHHDRTAVRISVTLVPE